MIMDKLYEAVVNISPVCLGLDTRMEFLPEYIVNSDMTLCEKLFEFNKSIVDSTKDIVGCYKVQIACYEALGIEGLKAYAQTLSYIRENDKIVIADIKRGDISSTAKMYAQGHFSGEFEADIITINAYMGEDAVSPYYPYLGKDKGIFILLKTSNPFAGDIQDLQCQDKKVYMHMGNLIEKWGNDYIGQSGFSSIGAVVGLTYPEEFNLIQDSMPNTFFLVPGYGAQGGTGKDISKILNKKKCAVINSSRGLITAHKGICEDKGFSKEVRNKTIEMKEDILQWLK